MTQSNSAGARFRRALAEEQPLQIMGTINAYTAMMAEQVGYRAIYLSGGGVANAAALLFVTLSALAGGAAEVAQLYRLSNAAQKAADAAANVQNVDRNETAQLKAATIIAKVPFGEQE